MAAAKKTAKNTKKPAGAAKAKKAAPAKVKQVAKKMENQIMTATKQYEKTSRAAANAGQDQMETIMKYGSILTQNMEEIMKTCMNIAQSAAEKSQENAKTMMSCKTLDEFTQAQSRFAQESLDEFMNGATKLSELSIKVYTECLEPINDQVGKNFKKAMRDAA